MKSKNTAETNETFGKRKYDLQWDKQNTKLIGMKLNKHIDADIFEYLAGITNVQGYLKQLIRDDIARQTQEKSNHT